MIFRKFCMRVLPSCMYVCAVPAESGKGVGILEVELHMIVSLHMGTGN